MLHALAPAAAKDPAAQVWHVAILVAPTAPEKVPAMHVWQLDEPAREYDPGLHGLQSPPAVLYWPAAQVKHAVLPASQDPPGTYVHVPEPAAHVVHEELPAAAAEGGGGGG